MVPIIYVLVLPVIHFQLEILNLVEMMVVKGLLINESAENHVGGRSCSPSGCICLSNPTCVLLKQNRKID